MEKQNFKNCNRSALSVCLYFLLQVSDVNRECWEWKQCVWRRKAHTILLFYNTNLATGGRNWDRPRTQGLNISSGLTKPRDCQERLFVVAKQRNQPQDFVITDMWFVLNFKSLTIIESIGWLWNLSGNLCKLCLQLWNPIGNHCNRYARQLRLLLILLCLYPILCTLSVHDY